ncbi:hypothetical protein C8R46DRAFT_581662 [Mycena filopes]|nr:hypothetical protein C8R46DRAFT_581662 [Mycena filopes]
MATACVLYCGFWWSSRDNGGTRTLLRLGACHHRERAEARRRSLPDSGDDVERCMRDATKMSIPFLHLIVPNRIDEIYARGPGYLTPWLVRAPTLVKTRADGSPTPVIIARAASKRQLVRARRRRGIRVSEQGEGAPRHRDRLFVLADEEEVRDADTDEDELLLFRLVRVSSGGGTQGRRRSAPEMMFPSLYGPSVRFSRSKVAIPGRGLRITCGGRACGGRVWGRGRARTCLVCERWSCSDAGGFCFLALRRHTGRVRRCVLGRMSWVCLRPRAYRRRRRRADASAAGTCRGWWLCGAVAKLLGGLKCCSACGGRGREGYVVGAPARVLAESTRMKMAASVSLAGAGG